MFKSIANRVWAFDAEWVPDPETGRAVYDLPDSMTVGEITAEMWKRAGADEEKPRPYLKTVLCRVVSISAMTRSVDEGNSGEVKLTLHSLPAIAQGEELSETQIISRFLEGVGRQQPQLVGYNSESADVRILLQRAVAHGISAAEFAKRPDKPWEGVDYFATSADWHIDLMEILAGRGRLRPSLHEMATACGIPGKFAGDGAEVVDRWQGGEIDHIVAYNECDAVTTYLLWLRLAHFGGFFSADEYEEEQDRAADLLRLEATNEGRQHLGDYLEKWQRMRRSAGRGQMRLQLR